MRVRTATAGDTKHGRQLYDGPGSHGLYLHVTPAGARSWVQQLMVPNADTGKSRRVRIGLGARPRVTLAQARKVAFANRCLRDEGRDPLAAKRQRAHEAARAARVPTFASAIEQVIAIRRPTWKNADTLAGEYRASLERYAGALGPLQVSRIAAADVMRVLAPHWHAFPAAADTARRRISAVLQWAIGQGYRIDDPAAKRAVGATRPWSIPEEWVDWIGQCVRHGCLDAPESHPYRGERPLPLCAAFPFDQYPVPCKSAIDIEGPRSAPGKALLDPEAFPLTFEAFLLWAHIHRFDTVGMTFPYPDVTFGADGDTQAVTAFARWLEASVQLGFPCLSGGMRGMYPARGDGVERRRAELAKHRDRIRALPAVQELARATTTMQNVLFRDLISFAEKDRAWYRVLERWTQSRIVMDLPIPRLVEEFWRQRPAEPKGRGGRLANRAIDALRSVCLVQAFTAGGLRVRERVRSHGARSVGATELAGALLGLSPDKVGDYWKRYKRRKFPMYLEAGLLSEESRVAAGSRPTGARADPGVPAGTGERLLDLFIRCSAESPEHAPRSGEGTGDESTGEALP